MCADAWGSSGTWVLFTLLELLGCGVGFFTGLLVVGAGVVGVL